MLLTGAVLAGLAIVFFSLFCFATIFILWTGRYYLASSVFLYVLFAVMFLAINSTPTSILYECYVFGTLGSFLLIAGALIASKSTADHRPRRPRPRRHRRHLLLPWTP